MMAGEIAKSPRILVVLMGSLGDLTRGLCLAHQIKSYLPNSHLSWVVDAKWRRLVEGQRYIDRVIIFQREKGLQAIGPLYRELREQSFDIVLDLQRILKSALIAKFSGGKRRITFSRVDSKEGNWIFGTEQIEPWCGKGSKLEAYLSFVKKLGGEVRRPLEFALPEAAESDAVRSLVEKHAKNYFVASVGSSWPTKDWPLEGYQKVIAALLANSGRRIVLVGVGDSTTIGARLIPENLADRVDNLIGKTTLPELVLIMKNALAGFGPDSGPAHIASAVKLPFVTLFGPTSPRLVAPYGNEQLSLAPALGCSPCYRRRCPGLGTLCMRMHSSDAVIQRLEAAMVGMG